MKRYLSAVLAVTLIAGLSACAPGKPAASTSSNGTSTPAPSQTARAVPSVVGVNFQDARTTLIEADFIVRILDKDGNKWTTTFPDRTVMVVGTSPAVGTVTDAEEIQVTVGVRESDTAEGKANAKADKEAAMSEAERAAEAKKAEAKAAQESAAARIAVRYTFSCTDGYISGAIVEYKSLKEVWASTAYKDKNSGPCSVTIDGQSPYEVTTLLPNEQAIAKVIASHGGGTSDSAGSDFAEALTMCAKPDSDLADQVSLPGGLQADAHGALALCPKAPHAGLLRQVATTVKIDDGTKVVGKEMPAGTYRTKAGAKDCYWSRTTGGGDIIANDMVGFAPAGVTVTVFPGEGFESNRCGVWTKIG